MLIDFLESEAGLDTVAVLAVLAFVGLVVGLRGLLDRSERPSGSDEAAGRAGGGPDDRTLAAVLVATCVVVPLVFTIAWQDAFVLPKLTALRLSLLVAVAVSVYGWAGRPRVPSRGQAASPRPGRPPVRGDVVIDLAVLVFVVLNIAATVTSIAPGHSLEGEPMQYQGLLTTLLYVAFFFLARTALGSPPRVTVLFGAVIGSATVVAVYAIVQQAHLDPIWPTLPRGRVFSTIGQANALAALLVLAAPLGLAFFRSARRPWQLLGVACMGLCLAALALTLSRGGYLGLGVGLAIVLVGEVAGRRVGRGPGRSSLVAIAIMLAIGGAAAVGPARDQALRVVDRALSTSDLSEGSIRSHINMWRVGARIALDHPTLGIGPEAFPLVFPAYRDAVLAPDEARFFYPYRIESPHNVYLATAVGAGLPALAAYLVLVGSILVRLARAATRASPASRTILVALFAAIAGHLVTDFFMTAEVTGSWLFWVLLGIGAALTSTAETEEVVALAPAAPDQQEATRPIPLGYGWVPASIHRRRRSTFSAGQASSQGMSPPSTAARMASPLALTSP